MKDDIKVIEKNFEDIKIGDESFFERVVVENDIIKFADISGDYNPLHLDEDYAQGTEFKGRIVHGMFIGALVSRLIGMELPGKKALLLKETLEFKKPVRVGDKLLVRGRVVHKSQVSQLVEILTEIYKADELLVSGSVHVRVFK